MAEIIQALDTSISRISVLKVFVLQYADATETAKLINDLFRNMGTSSGASRDPRAQFFAMMGGGPGGRGGRGGGDGGGGGASEARKAATSLTAVADTRMNAVVVSGPDELLPTIEQLISEIDKSAEQLKEIQVFTLKYADATEMTKVVNDVFQGKTTSSQSQGGRGGRGGMGMARFMGMNQPQGGTGEGRKAEENTVLAVADIRTNSVVVSASHDMMLQISGMVTALDLNPAKDQKVHVYPIKNASGAEVETILQGMFPGTTTGSRTSTSRTNTSTGRTGTSGNTRGSTSRSGSGSASDFQLGGSSSGR
jgi:type II secretory pathway component GspD/PulD (secretin)